MPYTEQQAAAIHTKHVSIALAAGAGCGKTFVLTERFVDELRLQPTPERLEELLAITFTDRAAREMRDRIRERLHRELLSCEETQVSSWQKILRDLESARIQTIHSFCTSTLRRFSHDLKIDPEFKVLDGPTAASLQTQVTKETLEKLLRAEDTDAFYLVLRFGLESLIRTLKSLLNQRFPLRETIEVTTSAEALVEKWREYHQKEFLPRKCRELAEWIKQSRLEKFIRLEVTTSDKWKERREVLLTQMEALNAGEIPTFEELESFRSAMTVQHVTAKHWSDEFQYELIKNGLKQLRELVDEMLPVWHLDERSLELSSDVATRMLRSLNAVVERYQSYKRELAAVDFDDLLLMTRDLVANQKSVRTALQHSTAFLMLDEFQDTDPVQAEIVRAICGTRLGSGGLFLVGDIKQSIYRFRRADPNVFRTLRGEIPTEGQKNLSRNFRSQQEILDFVNFLFSQAMDDQYDHLTAFDEKRYEPSTKVEFLWSSSEEEGKLSVSEKRICEADWIAARIRSLLDDPTPRIRSKGAEGETILRRTEAGDIVILLRAFSNLGTYEEALRRAQIDYYVVGGRAFFAQQEVYDLVNLCRFLDDPSDDIPLIGILRSPFFGWTDETLLAVGVASQSLWKSIQEFSTPELLEEQQAECFHRTREILTELLRDSYEANVGTVLRQAISMTGYDASLMTEFLGERKVANLQKLISLADQFDEAGILSLSDFCERLVESITEEADEEMAVTHAESGNVVRLMTVHQSKGLEFPVVISADINRAQNNSGANAVLHPELGPLVSLPMIQGKSYSNPALEMWKDEEKQADRDEAIRLFYVAATRAADMLILSSYWHPDEDLRGPWMKLLAERFDLATGLPAGDANLGQTAVPGVEREHIPEIDVVFKKPEVEPLERITAKLPLSDWDTKLSQTEPESPASLALPLPGRVIPFDRLSVSELESLVPAAPITKTKPAKIDPTESLSAADAELLGNVVHAGLERFQQFQDRPVDEIWATLAPQFDLETGHRIANSAQRRWEAFFQSSVAQELRESVLVEQEIDFLLSWPRKSGNAIVITGTIDCLFRDQQGNWHLIDYKTGRVEEDRAAILNHFGIQLLLYQLAVQKVTGQNVASIRLVQLGNQVREIPIEFSAQEEQTFRNQIDEAIALKEREWAESDRSGSN